MDRLLRKAELMISGALNTTAYSSAAFLSGVANADLDMGIRILRQARTFNVLRDEDFMSSNNAQRSEVSHSAYSNAVKYKLRRVSRVASAEDILRATAITPHSLAPEDRHRLIDRLVLKSCSLSEQAMPCTA